MTAEAVDPILALVTDTKRATVFQEPQTLQGLGLLSFQRLVVGRHLHHARLAPGHLASRPANRARSSYGLPEPFGP